MGDTMDGLLAQAEREGKWLYCAYQQLWFSPAQLRAHQDNGRFRWGPINWTLRDPNERIARARQSVEEAQAELDRVVAEVGT